jgi:hypothetical protein
MWSRLPPAQFDRSLARVSRRSNSAADETIGQAGLCEIADRSRELLSTAHSINAAEDNKIPRLIARAALP